MYSNLKAEMARKNVTNSDIATLLGKTKSTISFKMNDKNKETGFTLDEASKIKEHLGVDMSLEELFKKEDV